MMSVDKGLVKIRNDILLSLFICTPAINVIITTIIPALAGTFMAGLYLFIGLVVAIESVLRNPRGLHRIKVTSSGIILTAISVYYVVSLFEHKTDLGIGEFAVYTVIPLLIFSNNEYDYKRVIRICPALSFAGIFFINSIFLLTYNSITMGVSYAFLAPVVISLVYLVTDRGSKTINICAILHVFYLIQLFMYGSRGTLLSIGILLIILWVLRKKQSQIRISWIRFFLALAVIVIILVFFLDIINYINSVLRSAGIHLQFVDKILLLESRGNLGNGRNEIIELAWRHILQKPILGHGISTFPYYTSMDYPHNFVVQGFFDLGIIGMLIVFVPIVTATLRILHIPQDKLYFIVALFCSSVPGALFSGNMWRNSLLWLTFAFILKFGKERNVRERYTENEDSSAFI